jgi:TatD DNase family protein
VVNYDFRVGGVWPGAPFSIGVHPWAVGGNDHGGGNGHGGFSYGVAESDGGWLASALRDVETAPASAIGEIGLDFAPAVRGDHGEQKMVFAAQLRIAEERGLPVILHCVRAFEPVMEILSGFRLRAVIFHGFIGSAEQAGRATRTGYYLSFDARSLASPKTVDAMRATPLDKLFLETDDAEISIAEIYARAAGILAVGESDLAQQLNTNYSRIMIFNF